MHATDRERGTLRRWTGLALITVMAFGAMAGGAAAHTATDDHGTLTLHDSRDGEAKTADGAFDDRAELECEFWIRGHNMTHPNGSIRGAHDLGPSGHGHTVANWTGTANESGGWDFEVGPITLHEDGDWRIASTAGETGEHATQDHRIDYTQCEEAQEHPPDCPENVQVHARQDGSVHLAWNASEDTDEYRVYRADSGEDRFDERFETENTSFTDETTEPENTYEYMVVGVNEHGETSNCDRVEVTAIPFFGNPALVAMAAICSVGAVAAVRSRRG